MAKITVSHSQTVTVKVNQAGSWPPPSGPPPNTWISQATVVITAPISTTNITGLRTWTRGSSLVTDSHSAGRRISGSNSERGWLRSELLEVGGSGIGWGSGSGRCGAVVASVI